MSFFVDSKELYQWCRIPAKDLPGHSGLRVPFRVVKDSAEMGQLMARELAEVIEANNRRDVPTRAIVPCGPACWYLPWSRLINTKSISLKKVSIFHMDECLDWQARPLPKDHPLNFRTFMESHFYGDIRSDLNVPVEQRHWPTVATMDRIREDLANQPADICVGGWGQDGHVAYNQARRHPFSHVTLDEMAQSTIHVQENNIDTIMALAHRNFGAAYQFVPPMSITLGLKECLGAAKVRVYSDTGAWKQTALRVALFSPPVAEYPMTLLQKHKDAIITATQDTTRHPISENPEWDFFGAGQ